MSKRNLRIDISTVVSKLAEDCGVDSETTDYILKRYENEGIPFLTKTIVGFSKAVLEGLETGQFQCPTSIRSSYNRHAPKYFKGLIREVFHLSNGRIREDASAAAVYNIRQFCEYFYKLAVDFDEEQLSKAEEKYLATESEMAQSTFEDSWVEVLRKNFLNNYQEIAKAEAHNVFALARPRFGPGSFSGSSKLNVKFWLWKQLLSSHIGLTAESMRAFAGYFKSYPASKEAIKFVSEDKVCEVEFVPKDSRGPRTISKEPLFLVKTQMAYFDWLSEALQKQTRGRIQFTDQSINRELARQGSITKQWSTLDLKDASDRVQYTLALRVFENAPAMRWFLTNARSTHARMKISGDLVRLRKLSGMGSGLTFPTMALLIHLSICSQIAFNTRTPYRKVQELVYVYGDDVIVPSQWYKFAVAGLARSNLLVNKEKSYVQGSFRESCGGDYFNGTDVTPVRLRLSACGLKADLLSHKGRRRGTLDLPFDAGCLNIERHCRELIKKGNHNLAEYYYKRLEGIMGRLPAVYGESPVLGRYEITCFEHNDKVQRAWVPGVVRKCFPSTILCAYKYLAGFLKPRKESMLTLERSQFGELIVPRSYNLRKRSVAGVEMR